MEAGAEIEVEHLRAVPVLFANAIIRLLGEGSCFD